MVIGLWRGGSPLCRERISDVSGRFGRFVTILSQFACVVACGLLIWSAPSSAQDGDVTDGAPAIGTPSDELMEQSFPYEASGMDVREVLGDLSRRSGTPVMMGDGLRADVTIRNAEGSVADFLNQVSVEAGALWWFDGVAIHVERGDSIQSALVEIRGVPLETIEEQLSALGLVDMRFPIRATGDGALVRVVGPAGYVEQMSALVSALVEIEVARRSGVTDPPAAFVPRVYYGRPQ